MQSDLGKLFIGGISWDTNEDRLKEYFSTYGEVLEAVIMKDRNTGRARGFGFIVFSNPAVAEKVILEKHNIDGRMVEAKKAVPRDDQSNLSRTDSSIHGSPVPGRTRKIFVGGLASSVTESDFKAYFEQFGTITDVVVMYDHNTQRPRGFGFITYDSEEAVDEVLTKTFHELNGKMVEVKRAVPKELSPASARSPAHGFNYGMSRVDLLSAYNPFYSSTAIGLTMDGRFSPMSGGRTGLSPFCSAYGTGMNYEPGMNANLFASGNFNANPTYGRGMNAYSVGNNRIGYNIGHDGSNIGTSFSLSPVSRNLWGNGVNYGTQGNSRNSSVLLGSGNGTIGRNIFGGGTVGVGWSSSQISVPPIGRNNDATNRSGNFSYEVGDNNLSVGAGSFGRSIGTSAAPNSSYGQSNVAYDGSFTDLYTGGSVYGDSTWQFASSDRDAYGTVGHGGNASTDIAVKGSPGYMGSFGFNGRPANKGPPSHEGLS